MKLIWFGDSYTVGSELSTICGDYTSTDIDDKIYYLSYLDKSKYRPDLAFPVKCSQELDVDFLVLGAGGNPISKMYVELITYIKKSKSLQDNIAIFCLPTQYGRCYYVDNDKKLVRRPDDSILLHQDRFSIFETTMMLNGMYTACIANNIKPYFVPVWRRLEVDDSLSIIPDVNWLVDRNSTLVEMAWGFKNPPENWMGLVKGNFKVWHNYIKPLRNHPNIEGQNLLSSTMVNLLTRSLGSN